MKMVRLLILIYLCLHGSSLFSAKQSWSIRDFSRLSSSQARIDYINATFAQVGLTQYDSLLPIIQAKKDITTELFWHHRKHICLDIFSLTAAEKARNLQEMLLKARKVNNRVAEIVAEFHIDYLPYEQKQDSVVTLYYRNLKRFDEMKALGLSKFAVYDLNQLLWKMGKDLARYWQPKKGLDFLLIAEQYAKRDTVGQFYHTEVLSAMRNCYYHAKNFESANAYSQKVIDIHQALAPKPTPNNWWSVYWQMRAYFEIATLYYESWEVYGNKELISKRRYVSLCKGEKEELLNTTKQYINKGIALYQFPFDITKASPFQLTMENDALEELTNLQISLKRLPETKVLLARIDSIQRKLDWGFSIKWGLYRDYEKYYLAIHDYKNAHLYKGKMERVYIELYDRNAQNQLEEMKQVHQVDKYAAQVQTAEREKKEHLYLAIGAIFLALLISLAAYWVYYRIKKDNDIISSQKEQLENSLLEKEILLKEIHHRVKNNLQIISGLLGKQALKTTDELTRKLIKEGQDRVFSMALVHQNLYQSDNLSTIEIKAYLEMLIQNIEKTHKNPQQEISLHLMADTSRLNIDTVIPLGLILNELITNCYKYAFEGRDKGEIKVSFHKNGPKFTLSVSDDGIGLPPNLDIKKTRTLGLSLVNGLVRQLEGVLTFRADGSGTNFSIDCQV